MKLLSLLFLFVIFIHSVLDAQCITGDCYNGNGTYIFTNGDKYSGEWSEGLKEGYGRYDWADGSYYVGYFKDGFRDGQGNYVGADSVSLQGLFSKGEYIPAFGCTEGDCLNGKGTYHFDNGDKYTGDWINGKRTGYGRYDWGKGGYYLGDFKENKLHGNGAYYAPDGTNKIGKFENNRYIEGSAPTQEEKTPTPNTDYNTNNSKIPKSDSLSFEELLKEMNKYDSLDHKALEEAIRTSAKKDFCSLAQTAVGQFPSNFESLIGIEQKSYFSDGESWYANVMTENSIEAGIQPMLSASRAFYNILFEGDDFMTAKAKYDNYVSILNSCSISCCTEVYDTNDFKGESFESYMTYWLTFMVADGYNEAYKNMVIEIELKSSVIGPKWSVVFRVYKLEDK